MTYSTQTRRQSVSIPNALSPPSQGLLGHLPAFRNDPLGFLTHCARGYGDVVPLRFLHKRAFLLLNSDDIERVLATEHRQFVKPAWLRTPAVRRLLGDGLVTREGDSWRTQRQTCQPAFHTSLLEGYSATIATLVAKMLERWQPGETRDLQKDMTHLTLEVVVHTLFNVDIAGWTEETGEAIDALMDRFTARRSLFGMLPLPPMPSELRSARQLDRTIARFLHRQDAAEGAEADASVSRPTDLLWLLRHAGEHGGPGLGDRELQEQVKTFLAAGFESSALALCWAFLLLARHPEVEGKLAAELESALGGTSPRFADLPRLPYTRAVIQETLRLYPPLWMTGRQARDTCEIGGLRVPAGAMVLTSQWAVQRHPRYFPQPDAFRPERWEGTETACLPRFAYFPFGGGPRVCIGQRFAMMEATLLLASIAQRFHLELPPGQEIEPWATMTLRPPVGLRVRVRLKKVTRAFGQ